MTTLPVVDQARSADDVLSRARELVEPAHRAVIDTLPSPVRHIVGYHVGWWDAEGNPSDRNGKSVRPALVLAAAGAVGGERCAAVTEAVAVELVHDFSLLHDDIIDGDPTRRHRPGAWSVFGVGPTILAGDTLLALASHILAESPGLRSLTGAELGLCAGQSADMAFEQRADVSLAECVDMAVGKTAALLACACELGAVAGGGDRRQCELLAEFGRRLGLAFQLTDDLLGIWGDPAVTGKPTNSDLANHKKSLPVVAALTSGTIPGDHLALLYQGEKTDDRDTLGHMADLVEAAGGRAWGACEAERQRDKALALLAEAAPDVALAEDLRILADLMTHRDC
ncbi:MAG TPA: polyprenyl synthetase family protein [Solirubrobacteraceae bacterium]|jgi:geranylgeranyl diphosphate synthase type I|nr:polyprenyl synthetase family protein [Solirubrobacteraceae bacterium]